MTVTDERTEVELPPPPPCPGWCNGDHANDDVGATRRYRSRQHKQHLDTVRIQGVGFFDISLFAHDHLWVDVSGKAMRWGRDPHERPVIDLSGPGGSESIKLQSKAALNRFLAHEAFMYRPVVERIREAARLLGWEAP